MKTNYKTQKEKNATRESVTDTEMTLSHIIQIPCHPRYQSKQKRPSHQPNSRFCDKSYQSLPPLELVEVFKPVVLRC